AVRLSLGCALLAQSFYGLALLGILTPPGIAAATGLWILGAWKRGGSKWEPPPIGTLWFGLFLLPLLALALHPPLAFDETLYHMPFVRDFARAGGLVFLPNLRFPAFATPHEIL
ncbi:unnamed protein product, partial [Phaeothamnion confervicola]